ncbi:MAG: hypothetical protein HY033_09605 [Ignavibacteriae bacterium]|nr:hypothetical protein [Ignavibacteriota bacterium]
MEMLALVMGWIIAILVGLLGLVVVWNVVRGKIDLTDLVSEPPKPDGTPGGASLSRFQFLIFTFVVGMSLFLIIVNTGAKEFPKIDATILGLIGISGGSYIVSKGIQSSRDTNMAEAEAKKPSSVGTPDPDEKNKDIAAAGKGK